jgi:hypothetical protein
MLAATLNVVAVLLVLLLAPAALILTVGLALRALGVPRRRVEAWALRMAGRCTEHGMLRGAAVRPLRLQRRGAVTTPLASAPAPGTRQVMP